jgi:hypothetical protein
MRVDRVADGDADAQHRRAFGRRVRRADGSACCGRVGSAGKADDGGADGSHRDARADDRNAVGVADECRADARADSAADAHCDDGAYWRTSAPGTRARLRRDSRTSAPGLAHVCRRNRRQARRRRSIA